MTFQDIAAQLNALLDEDPQLAIIEASKLGDDINSQMIKAGIFVDAGAATKNKEAIETGVEIYQNALEQYPLNTELVYNLANGFHALAISTHYVDFSWYQETQANRQKARKLFYQSALSTSATTDTKSQAFTNLGNILWSSYRWVEAYDFYMMALEENARNGVASSGALKMLRYALSQNIGDFELLSEEIEHLAAHVQSNIGTIQTYAGKTGAEGILGEIHKIPTNKKIPTGIQANKFIDFVVRNNLALSPTIHSFKQDESRWDNLSIASVTVSTSSGSAVPELFAMLNIIKSDYILARQILFGCQNGSFADSGTYSDTLDYACYGVNESALSLAQRVALDILDKVAVASLSYLEIGGARSTSFKSAWFKVDGTNKKLAPKILQEIKSGNTALLALSEISNDLSEGENGYLSEKQQARNSTTHRFTVLHDMVTIPESESRCLEHYDYDSFKAEAMSTLKLARSSIIYFVQMIQLREERLSASSTGITMPMVVPSHHHIRGFDD